MTNTDSPFGYIIGVPVVRLEGPTRTSWRTAHGLLYADELVNTTRARVAGEGEVVVNAEDLERVVQIAAPAAVSNAYKNAVCSVRAALAAQSGPAVECSHPTHEDCVVVEPAADEPSGETDHDETRLADWERELLRTAPEPTDQGEDDEDRIQMACNWAEWRKEYGAGVEQYQAFVAGWKAASSEPWHDTPEHADQGEERTTTLTVTDSPKMLHETLAVAQARIANSPSPLDEERKHEHIYRLQRLIDECERHRPIGPNGKHDDRHTPTCGCRTPAPPADRTPDATTLPSTPWTTAMVWLGDRTASGRHQTWRSEHPGGHWYDLVTGKPIPESDVSRVSSFTTLAEPPNHEAYEEAFGDGWDNARLFYEPDDEPASGQPDGDSAELRLLARPYSSLLADLMEYADGEAKTAEDRAVERAVEKATRLIETDISIQAHKTEVACRKFAMEEDERIRAEGYITVDTLVAALRETPQGSTARAVLEPLADRLAQSGQPNTEKEES